MTHICVGNLTIIGSDNGLSPGRRQAIIWTNAGILLIEPLGINFSQILIEINTFSFNKMHLKMSSAKWRLFRLGLNVLSEKPLSETMATQLTTAFMWISLIGNRGKVFFRGNSLWKKLEFELYINEQEFSNKAFDYPVTQLPANRRRNWRLLVSLHGFRYGICGLKYMSLDELPGIFSSVCSLREKLINQTETMKFINKRLNWFPFIQVTHDLMAVFVQTMTLLQTEQNNNFILSLLVWDFNSHIVIMKRKPDWSQHSISSIVL